MSRLRGDSFGVRRGRNIWSQLGAAALMALVPVLGFAQNCTTQAKMNGLLRSSLSDAALSLATDVKSGNVDKLKSEAIEEYAANFSQATFLIQGTAAKIGGDTLQVEQMYVLDARNRKSADQGDADFSCPLADSSAETDFSISGLPPGLYAFAMVDATGNRPWLISMLLRQEAGHWKLAGLYPHARTAAGEDGIWYWKKARAATTANQLWYAWLLYSEADALLRPSNFTSTTNLEKLRSEQRSATPSELADGIGNDNPLVLKGAEGSQYRLTSIGSEGAEDGRRVNVVLHYTGDPALAGAQATAKNAAVAAAFVNAHADVKQGFDGVIVIADVAGHPPFVTEQKMDDIH